MIGLHSQVAGRGAERFYLNYTARLPFSTRSGTANRPARSEADREAIQK
jgi:hypothetical protein